MSSYLFIVPLAYLKILRFLKRQNKKVAGESFCLFKIIFTTIIDMTLSKNIGIRKKKNIVSIGEDW